MPGERGRRVSGALREHRGVLLDRVPRGDRDVSRGLEGC